MAVIENVFFHLVFHLAQLNWRAFTEVGNVGVGPDWNRIMNFGP